MVGEQVNGNKPMMVITDLRGSARCLFRNHFSLRSGSHCTMTDITQILPPELFSEILKYVPVPDVSGVKQVKRQSLVYEHVR